MTIREILQQYPNLPRKFLVKFALFCANDIKHLIDQTSIKALESTELWLEDKISQEDMQEASRNAAYTVYDTDYAAANADAAAAYTADATSAYDVIYDIAVVAYYSAKALNIPEDRYRDKLLEMIEELTDLEKLLYLK